MFPLGDTVKSEVRARGRAARPGRGAQGRQPRHLLHRRRRHRGVPRGAGSARSRAISSTSPARWSGGTTAPTRSPSASATACGSGVPGSDGKPRYVLGIEPVSGQVRVGAGRAARRARRSWPTSRRLPLRAGRHRPGAGRAPRVPGPGPGARRAGAVPATYDGERLTAVLDAPVSGVAAGQGLVLYDGDRVLAAGRIASARMSAPDAATRGTRRDPRGRCPADGWRPASGRCPAPTSRPRSRVVRDTLPDLPHLPELPGRGPGADLIGRGAALLVGPAGGPAAARLAAGRRARPRPRRAASYLRADLDELAEAFDGYAGPFKVQVTGPVDPGRVAVAAPRRAGADRPRCPPRHRRVAGRRARPSTSPPSGAALPGRAAGGPGRRAVAARGAGRPAAHRVRATAWCAPSTRSRPSRAWPPCSSAVHAAGRALGRALLRRRRPDRAARAAPGAGRSEPRRLPARRRGLGAARRGARDGGPGCGPARSRPPQPDADGRPDGLPTDTRAAREPVRRPVAPDRPAGPGCAGTWS